MATDREIQEIIEQGEAGVEDLLRAYEVAEGHYVAAAAQVPLDPVYFTTTSATTDSRPLR